MNENSKLVATGSQFFFGKTVEITTEIGTPAFKGLAADLGPIGVHLVCEGHTQRFIPWNSIHSLTLCEE